MHPPISTAVRTVTHPFLPTQVAKDITPYCRFQIRRKPEWKERERGSKKEKRKRKKKRKKKKKGA
jgi:hypothetical protein